MGKQIELVMTGAETELDRTVLDAIKDPLTHMVRNSGDHGIEPPAARRSAGKPEFGTIKLDAFHEGDTSSSTSPTTVPGSRSTKCGRKR